MLTTFTPEKVHTELAQEIVSRNSRITGAELARVTDHATAAWLKVREQIRNGPEFDPSVCVDRAFEERYFGYYGYPVYW